jgi:hypothetical protein
MKYRFLDSQTLYSNNITVDNYVPPTLRYITLSVDDIPDMHIGDTLNILDYHPTAIWNGQPVEGHIHCIMGITVTGVSNMNIALLDNGVSTPYTFTESHNYTFGAFFYATESLPPNTEWAGGVSNQTFDILP